MTDLERARQRIRGRLKEQRLLVATLLRLREQLGGSLFVRYAACGKEACACRSGKRHGPYYVFSARSGGSGEFAYMAKEDWVTARDLIDRHREFRQGLARLQKVNTEIVLLLRKYQDLLAVRGARRLGISPAIT